MLINNLPRVIAHRGASAYAPENTLAAMSQAKVLGASWVEFDVQLTRDDILVVFHDESLDRTTNGQGRLREQQYAQLAQLDAGSWFSHAFYRERIASLADMLAYLQQIGLNANIELKSLPGDEKIVAEKFALLLTQAYNKLSISCIVSSFSVDTLYYVRQLMPTIPIGILFSKWRDDWQVLAEELDCYSLHFRYNSYSKNRVVSLKKSGCKLFAYTVNDIRLAERLFAMGIDVIFTDYPDRFF